MKFGSKKKLNDTVFYIFIFIIIAHFVVSFVFLVKKLSGPVREEPWEEFTEDILEKAS